MFIENHNYSVIQKAYLTLEKQYLTQIVKYVYFSNLFTNANKLFKIIITNNSKYH